MLKTEKFLPESFFHQDIFDFFTDKPFFDAISWLHNDSLYSLWPSAFSLFCEDYFNALWVYPNEIDISEDVYDIIYNDKRTTKEKLNLKGFLLVKSMGFPYFLEKKLKRFIIDFIKAALHNSRLDISQIKRRLIISLISVLRSLFFYYYLYLKINEITLYIRISDILVSRNTPLYHTTWRLHIFKPFLENK